MVLVSTITFKSCVYVSERVKNVNWKSNFHLNLLCHEKKKNKNEKENEKDATHLSTFPPLNVNKIKRKKISRLSSNFSLKTGKTNTIKLMQSFNEMWLPHHLYKRAAKMFASRSFGEFYKMQHSVWKSKLVY